MLHEFIENLEKVKGTTIINPEAMRQMEETKASIGRLKIAQQEYAAEVSSSWTPISNWFRDLRTAWNQAEIDHAKFVKEMKHEQFVEVYGADTGDAAREAMHAKGMSGNGEEKKHLKKAEKEKDTPTLDSFDAAQTEMAKKVWEELDKGLNKQGEDEKKIRKAVSDWDKELDKLDLEDKLNYGRMGLAQQKANLDQQVAMGAITVQQEIAQRRTLLEQTTAMETAELAKRLDDDKLTLIEKTKVSNEIMALNRKAALEEDQLNKKQAQDWKHTFDDLTSGWTTTIQKMVNGQQTFAQGMKSMILEVGSGLEQMFIKMGLDAVKNFVISQVAGKTADTSQAMGAAAVYAVNAAASVAAIPGIGWTLAPGVMSEAYASGLAMAGLASAAGGWDRVPSDQLAMIHKNEMVLPAHLAEPIRQMAASGGAGAEVHIHAVDAQSVQRLFARNQGSLMKVMGQAARNGRWA